MRSAFDEAVADALTTVRLVPRWHLDGAAWDAVHQILDRLEAAIATKDGRALSVALRDLEDHGPSRLAAISTRDPAVKDEPPPRVLDLVNSLVHPSGGWSGGSASPNGGTGRS